MSVTSFQATLLCDKQVNFVERKWTGELKASSGKASVSQLSSVRSDYRVLHDSPSTTSPSFLFWELDALPFGTWCRTGVGLDAGRSSKASPCQSGSHAHLLATSPRLKPWNSSKDLSLEARKQNGLLKLA